MEDKDPFWCLFFPKYFLHYLPIYSIQNSEFYKNKKGYSLSLLSIFRSWIVKLSQILFFYFELSFLFFLVSSLFSKFKTIFPYISPYFFLVVLTYSTKDNIGQVPHTCRLLLYLVHQLTPDSLGKDNNGSLDHNQNYWVSNPLYSFETSIRGDGNYT